MATKKNLRYTSTHEWVEKIDETSVRVGITDFAQRELGDIVYIDVPQLNVVLSVDEPFGTVEAIKTVSDLYMPLDGEVVELNTFLSESPEKVNQDPYNEGWIIKIKMSNPKQFDALLEEGDYQKLID